jgi:hypothetical protein
VFGECPTNLFQRHRSRRRQTRPCVILLRPSPDSPSVTKSLYGPRVSRVGVIIIDMVAPPKIRRIAGAVATRREDHRSPRSSPAVRHRRWGQAQSGGPGVALPKVTSSNTTCFARLANETDSAVHVIPITLLGRLGVVHRRHFSQLTGPSSSKASMIAQVCGPTTPSMVTWNRRCRSLTADSVLAP